MRMTVAVLVIQNAIKLFEVESFSLSRLFKLQIGVLAVLEIAAWVHTRGYLVWGYIQAEPLLRSLSSLAKDSASVPPRAIWSVQAPECRMLVSALFLVFVPSDPRDHGT